MTVEDHVDALGRIPGIWEIRHYRVSSFDDAPMWTATINGKHWGIYLSCETAVAAVSDCFVGWWRYEHGYRPGDYVPVEKWREVFEILKSNHDARQAGGEPGIPDLRDVSAVCRAAQLTPETKTAARNSDG